jgi:hypothetical protein
MKAERSESNAVKKGRLIEKDRDESIDGMQIFISATKHKAQKALQPEAANHHPFLGI